MNLPFWRASKPQSKPEPQPAPEPSGAPSDKAKEWGRQVRGPAKCPVCWAPVNNGVCAMSPHEGEAS